MADSITPSASFLRKKVAGVPVLYLLGALALVMAVYAWRTKATSGAAAPAGTPTAAPGAVVTAGDGSGTNSVLTSPTPSSLIATSPYASLLPTATAYASLGQPVTNTAATPAIASNQDWLSQGVAYLIAQGNTGGAAQSALQTYLTGGQLSMAQGQMRDSVIKQYGLPPNPPDSVPVPDQTPAQVAQSTHDIAHASYYARKTGTQAVYAIYPDGSRQWLTRQGWLNIGSPTWYDVPASDPVWSGPVIGVDAPANQR